jgi:hypothetical protein
MRLISAVMRHLEQTADLFDGKLPGMAATAGLDKVTETGHVDTVFGPLVLLRAVRPE